MNIESSARTWAGALISLGLIGIMGFAAVRIREFQDGARPDPINSNVFVDPNSPLFAQDAADSAGRLRLACQTQTQLIRSTNVLTNLVVQLEKAHPELLPKKGDPIAWLREAIHIEVKPDSSMLTITMPGVPLELRASSINILVSAYFTAFREWESTVYGRRIKQAEEIDALYRRELASKRMEFRQEEAGNAPAERLDQIRDEVAIREAVSLKLGIALEERRLDRKSPRAVRLLNAAAPPKIELSGVN
jgi:hypothetical protein